MCAVKQLLRSAPETAAFQKGMTWGVHRCKITPLLLRLQCVGVEYVLTYIVLLRILWGEALWEFQCVFSPLSVEETQSSGWPERRGVQCDYTVPGHVSLRGHHLPVELGRQGGDL